MSAKRHFPPDLREGLKAFDSANNPTHRFIADFILNEADAFAKSGGDALVRDGKTFVTPDKFTPEVAKTSWTFTDDDIMERLKATARKEAAASITAREQEAAKQGFVRVKKTAPKEVVKEVETPAPKAAGGKSPGPVASEDTQGASVLQRLLNLKTPA